MQEFNKENYYKQGGSKLLQETVNMAIERGNSGSNTRYYCQYCGQHRQWQWRTCRQQSKLWHSGWPSPTATRSAGAMSHLAIRSQLSESTATPYLSVANKKEMCCSIYIIVIVSLIMLNKNIFTILCPKILFGASYYTEIKAVGNYMYIQYRKRLQYSV